MMIVPVVGRGVFPTDVDNGVAFLQTSRITGTDKRRWAVGWQEAEQVNC